MNIKAIAAAVIVAGSIGGTPAGAVTADDFIIRDAKDLADLCATQPADPAHVAALQFCYGYLQGAYDYYLAERRGPDAGHFVCLPKPEPSREAVVRLFLAWLEAHPGYGRDAAIEVLFRFGADQWPCPEKDDAAISAPKS
ncbi:Rap1a/Tai family immunity protein [Methylococcus capsulatus]|mgnify:CR=1 FL=1|jgi:hypothetical protein|uniref:Rap1a immunity protein domain-containing protein n=1 Tax=Methylococcus capsulatus (strain ATCC 33009 / NCIMB 11132 / Bath) TaxID=243233 RepID=Q60BJ6_METCA|nr:Rap1a/Tai family immunity protein [Methylococcus capsulatus]AAU90352.1 hypothetical protein MCA0470 [Methylococcus capsulatus str. Bath]QXP88714.1 hypothetical protein KW112_06315 [Methylococcus capsulatus]QXP89913.1 hypothetical protein KW114_12660 [Methylococcus capsulatus]QXP94254.1 hypothetical protein KW113_03320 [Methylococcus capsulatus]